jgi:hypothetical protein
VFKHGVDQLVGDRREPRPECLRALHAELAHQHPPLHGVLRIVQPQERSWLA